MTTHINRVEEGLKATELNRIASSDTVRLAIQRAKDAVLFDYAPRAGEHARLLQLVLNEAEGLAWQTEVPHLVFPTLALEKAEATVAWHQRQVTLRRPAAEIAFAE
jgi:hypothetical protein